MVERSVETILSHEFAKLAVGLQKVFIFLFFFCILRNLTVAAKQILLN
jgi:hypothetical protein